MDIKRQYNPGVLKNLPNKLHYIIEPALKYGWMMWDHEIKDFLEKAPQEELSHLRSIAGKLHAEGDIELIDQFIDRYPADKYDEAARLLWFALLLEYLGHDLGRCPPDRKIHPGVLLKLPEDMQYLTEPALEYGWRQSDEDIFAYMESASEDELQRLAAIAERIKLRDDLPNINEFLSIYSMTSYEECARLHYFILLLDYYYDIG